MAPLIASPLSLSSSSIGERVVATTTYHRSPMINVDNTQVRSQSEPALHQTCSNSPIIKPRRRISFNERVSVREFESNSWHPIQDMEQLSPVGGSPKTTIAVPKIISFPRDYGDYDLDPMFPLCPTLGANSRTTTSTSSSSSSGNNQFSMQHLLRREIVSILMVDPHDICLTIFSKRLQDAMPHARIWTTHSSEEAIHLCSKQSFDVIITEERLSLFHRHKGGGGRHKLASGSALLAHLKQHSNQLFRQALLIGVSAHWQSDHPAMVQSGADYCWSKAPPPTLNTALLEELLHTLLLKRGKHKYAKAMMVASSAEELSPSPILLNRKQ